MALMYTRATEPRRSRSQVAFSDDGTKVVAFDQEGRDHQVNVFPGGDVELIGELRKHNVQFAVVPPPEANPALQLLQGFGGLLINFLPLFLLLPSLRTP